MDVLRIASDAGNQGRVFDAAYRRADKSSRDVLCGHDEASYLKKYSRVVSASATNICKLARLRFTSTTVPSRLLPHLITLSARYKTDGGIVSPICLAVLRLIANSNAVAAPREGRLAWRTGGVSAPTASIRRSNSAQHWALAAR